MINQSNCLIEVTDVLSILFFIGTEPESFVNEYMINEAISDAMNDDLATEYNDLDSILQEEL